ncbi:MAG TPA: rhodanese-like domain-containing protein [Verrucomicrobiae bacterium]|jgi:rhodanese-related sulfurtransferase|nr:rhodanese-like domain-containing protein [Verrucomicrobiae bacterium]
MRLAQIQKILLEALAVGLFGALVSFAANQVSPRGLALNRNYFPQGVAAARTNAPAPVPSAADDPVTARLKGKGLSPLTFAETKKLVGQPGVIFVDARDEEKFEAGHIPGAYQLDPYHPETAIGAVLAAGQAAEKIIVYCAGGECEDADSVAILLRDGGAPADHVFVYGGGMTEWTAQHQPLEKGTRP